VVVLVHRRRGYLSGAAPRSHGASGRTPL